MEVVQINASIVHIPFFGIDVPVSSQCIGFTSKSLWTETDDHVELAKELRPTGLSLGQEFGGGKVLQVFVIRNDVDGGSGAF